MKTIAMSAFRSPIIGRPTRKILWSFLSLLRKISIFVEYLYVRHPFVKALTLELDDNPERQLDSVYGQGFDAKTIYKHYQFLQESVNSFPIQPTFLLVILIKKDTSAADLEALVTSINLQIYSRWEIIFCLEEGAKIETFEKVVKGINFCTRSLLNDLLTSTRCDYFSLLEADCVFYPSALAEMVKAVHFHQQPDILYSDEIFEDNETVYHKPAWSPLLLYAKNYLGQLTLVKVAKYRDLDLSLESATMYCILIALSGRSDLCVAHLPIVLAMQKSERIRGVNESESLQVADVISQSSLLKGHGTRVSLDSVSGVHNINFDLVVDALVSIIIPTKNGFDFLKPCIDSIFKRSTYRNFEIVVVDHQSDDPQVLSYLEELQQKTGQVKVVRYSGEFNFGRMNNLGAKAAQGEYFVTLNNDTEVISPDWLERMLGWSRLPFVGAVGAKLLFADQTIQHAGIFGCGYMSAAHAALGKSANTAQYFGYFQCTHEVLGVTAACMMIARDKFWAVGGFDEIFVPNGWGDVDFCLKLSEKGWSNVYTPTASLYHKESKSRGRNVESFERHYLMHRYAKALLEDPYHNVNLMPLEYKPYPLYSGHQVGPSILRRVLSAPMPTIELIVEYGETNKTSE